MSLNDVDPETLDLINKLNPEIGALSEEVVKKIAIGVCEAYSNSDPVRIAMIQLITIMRFSNEIQKTMIEVVMHGLEGVGIMTVIPDAEIVESPEFKAMKEHFERLKKEK